MKSISTLFIALLLVIQPARANTFGTDMSDLWWNPSESGWGVNIIHQSDVLFLTFFVYGADGKAIWYAAPNVPYASTNQGSLAFTGFLYQTSGPWLGGAFDPKAVTVRQVGSVTFTATSTSAANLTYTVDNTQVSKAVVRQTWRNNSLDGSYLGAETYTATNCAAPYSDGTYTQVSYITINNSESTFSFNTTDRGGTCAYTGNYTQAGRMGQSVGGFTCSDGTKGTFTAFELESNPIGITGRINAQSQYCTSVVAKFAALRN